VSEQVLHLDFIKLTPETSPERRSQLEAAAATLREIDGVAGVGVIEGQSGSDFDLAFWFVLRAFTSLEPFGTDPRYAQFLQASAAPLLQGFGGADVKLDADFEAADGPAACMALTGPEEAYDFEVREGLEAWADGIGAPGVALGLAVGERQVYRGAVIAFGGTKRIEKPEIEPFRATLISGRARVLA
jgi:hypothetical protein